MLKNNYTLQYFNRYDFLQNTKQGTIYKDGTIKSLKFTFTDKSITENSVSSQIKYFLCSFLLNEQFVKISKHGISNQKLENSNSTFFFECCISSYKKIFSFINQLYFLYFYRNVDSRISFSVDRRNAVIKVTIPAIELLQIKEIVDLLGIDLKNMQVCLEFFISSKNFDKQDIRKIFPFWMNG